MRKYDQNSQFIYSSQGDYRNHLTGQRTEAAIDRLNETCVASTVALTASVDELNNTNIEILKATNDGFETLSYQLDEVSTNLEALDSTFRWGFHEVIKTLNLLDFTLETLLKTAQTPAQTWALEQFDTALNAYRRGLYPESLEYVNRALSGHGDNVGYNLDDKFYLLLGSLHLGSVSNNSKEIVDLNKAMDSFLKAIRYTDDIDSRSRAYTSAGYTCYCLGEMDKAIDYQQQAIQLNNASQAHYQLAKIYMNQDKPDKAIPHLRHAIDDDRFYTLRAATDDDFIKHIKLVDKLIEDMRHERIRIFNGQLVDIEGKIKKLQLERETNFDLSELHLITKLKNDFEQNIKTASTKTLFGSMDALISCENFKQTIIEVRQLIESEHNEKFEENRTVDALHREKLHKIGMSCADWSIGLGIAGLCCNVVTAVPGLVLGIIAIYNIRASKKGDCVKAIVGVVINAVWATIFLLYMIASVMATMAEGLS